VTRSDAASDQISRAYVVWPGSVRSTLANPLTWHSHPERANHNKRRAFFLSSRFPQPIPGQQPCPVLINLRFRSHTHTLARLFAESKKTAAHIMGIELFGRLLICKGASARPPRFISRQRGAKSNYHLRCLILQIIANKFTAGLTLLGLLCTSVCSRPTKGAARAMVCAPR